MIAKFPEPLLEQFGIIHHKALNTRKNLKKAVDVAAQYGDQLHIFEGDLCWYFNEATGKFDFYFFHPNIGFDRLSAKKVAKYRKSGAVITLEDAISAVPEKVLLIIELKVGTGDLSKCFDQLIVELQANFSGRFWIDTFSKSQLEMIYAKDKSIPLSIHTERIIGNRLLTVVPEWPTFYTTKLCDLAWLDGFSIRHWDNFSSITHASKYVKRHNKALFVSRIFTKKRLKHCLALGAQAGYFETKDIQKFIPIIQAHTNA